MLRIKKNDTDFIDGMLMLVYSFDGTELYAPFSLKPLIGLALWKIKELFRREKING